MGKWLPWYPGPQIEGEGQSWSLDEVIAGLDPYLSEARRNRFAKVIESRSSALVPVMENIHDLGNLSAVMRTCEALGLYRLEIIEYANKKFRKANRPSRGADKWLRIGKWNNPKECIRELKTEGYRVYATHLDESQPLPQVDLSGPVALVFGNEHSGVSQELLDEVDGRVIVPMQGFSQSLNISVAAALGLYHILLHKRQSGERLKPDEQESLVIRANYLLRSVNRAKMVLAAETEKVSEPEAL